MSLGGFDLNEIPKMGLSVFCTNQILMVLRHLNPYFVSTPAKDAQYKIDNPKGVKHVNDIPLRGLSKVVSMNDAGGVGYAALLVNTVSDLQ